MAVCPAVIVAELGDGETEKSGVGDVVPLPLSVTLCGLPGAVSVMVTDPERNPVAVGLNVTFTVQLAPGFKAVQLLVCAKSPEAAMLLTVSAALPLLLMLKLLATLVVFNCCAENVMLEVESASSGLVAVLQAPFGGAIPEPPLNS